MKRRHSTFSWEGSGAEIVELYDDRDRLAEITADATTIYASITYDDADRLTARTSGPGGISTYTYDDDGRLTEAWHKDDSTATLVKLAYGYDPVGNRKYKEDLKSGLSSWSEVYFYDGLHRLRDFRRGTLNGNKDGIATAVSPPFTYTQEWLDFDLLGNWLQSKTRVATTPTATLTTDDRTVNSVNEYLTQQINGGSTTNFANDDNGNLLDDGTQEYVYDAENRLIEVIKKGSPDETIQEYQYDALGRRVKTVDNCPSSCTGGCCSAGVPACIAASSSAEIWHIYAATPACIEEYEVDSPNVLQRYFVHGMEFPDPLVMVDNTAVGSSGAGTHEFFWYLKDALGSIVALKNSSDGVVERYVYDPYGKTTVTNASGTPLTPPTDCLAAATPSAYANPFCWTGQRYDARTGLYHFWFRSYSPPLGRWLQRDPAWYHDGMNLVEYVRSRPLFFLDKYGLQTPAPPSTQPSSQPSGEPASQPSSKPSSQLSTKPCPPGMDCPDLGGGVTGRKRTPNDPNAPTNGCTVVPDAPAGYDFTSACNQHDRCYGTVGKTKSECDYQFLQDMYAICRGLHKANLSDCGWWAQLYYAGVVNLGGRAYKGGQKDALKRQASQNSQGSGTAKPSSNDNGQSSGGCDSGGSAPRP